MFIFPGVKTKQNFRTPQLRSSITHTQLPLQSAKKDKYNFSSLRLCSRTTDFPCKACYLDLILVTTISCLQRQTQSSEGQIQSVRGWLAARKHSMAIGWSVPPKKWASVPTKEGQELLWAGFTLCKMLFGWEKWNKTLSVHFSIISLLPPAQPSWSKAFLLTPDSPSPALHSCWSPAPVRATQGVPCQEGVVQEAPVHVSPSCGLSHGASCPCSRWAEGKGEGPTCEQTAAQP